MLGKSVLAALALAGAASAVCGTHSYTTCDDGITHWFDPNTGEICDPLDCGGGRAPPKKDVPGCAAYTGTETRRTEASYLSCWTPPGGRTTMVGVGDKSTSAEGGNSPAATTTAAAEVSSSSSAAGDEGSASGAVTTPTTKAGGVSASASGSASGEAPSTTEPATLTTAVKSSGSASGSGSGSASGSAAGATTTNAGAVVQGGSLMVVAGAAMGAVALM
ncbi:hypothetical protein VFPBJ_00347 [Purpureocillium lilacinum]|uniref:Siderophore biosynthesis enzyme n=1 Tax=Purpureocillium lilacinum TaxID=33203 RepID=A0A179H836_PURLI|nr:hypothetical protein VFPBJ_00347 [Purpureocillium lilacinum]